MINLDLTVYDKKSDKDILAEAARFQGFSDPEVHGAMREILLGYLNSRATMRLEKLTVTIRNLTWAIIGLTTISIVLFCIQWLSSRGK